MIAPGLIQINRLLLLCLCLLMVVAPAAADQIDARVDRLNELLKDYPTVVVERRADEVVATGWVRSKDDRKLVDKILDTDKDVLDLISEDLAGSDRMVEIDVAIIVVTDTISKSVGFDFLSMLSLDFSAEKSKDKLWDWDFSGKIDYNVNIANATEQLVDVVARPHLATLNGETAEFLAGGEIVFKVQGINSGRIQPYPYGIRVKVTPTILKTPGPNGETQVLMDIEASRLSVLGFQLAGTEQGSDDVSFDKTEVKSKALLPMNETLILSGLYQSEIRQRDGGVPVMRKIPFVKYFFSNESKVAEVLSTIIVVTPREPGILNEEHLRHLDWFIRRRAKYIEARRMGGEVLQQFKEEYPNWYKPQWNRYATHFFLLQRSSIYKELRGEDLRADTVRRDIMSVWSAEEVARRAR
jgi:hypothetical protein